MENLIVAVNCVIPVFICLAVGYIAKMRRVIPEGTYPYINRFSFTVLLSVQMFHNVYSAEFNRAFSPRLIAYLLGATLFIYITAGLISDMRSKILARGGLTGRMPTGRMWQLSVLP